MFPFSSDTLSQACACFLDEKCQRPSSPVCKELLRKPAWGCWGEMGGLYLEDLGSVHVLFHFLARLLSCRKSSQPFRSLHRLWARQGGRHYQSRYVTIGFADFCSKTFFFTVFLLPNSLANRRRKNAFPDLAIAALNPKVPRIAVASALQGPSSQVAITTVALTRDLGFQVANHPALGFRSGPRDMSTLSCLSFKRLIKV